MSDNVITAVLALIGIIASGLISGWWVYRRSVKVDLRKVAAEEDFGLIDRWREYSSELRQQVTSLTAETREQDAKIDQLQAQNRDYARRIWELEQRLADMERRLAGVEKKTDS